MRRKHIGKIIIAFVLMYMSTHGQLIEEWLNLYSDMYGVPVSELPDMGVSYSSIIKEVTLISCVSLCISTVVMMIVPFIVRMVKRKRLPSISGKRLCMWNSIVLFVLPLIAGKQVVGGLGALIYYFINKWLFVDE